MGDSLEARPVFLANPETKGKKVRARDITINETYRLKDGRQCLVTEATGDGYFLVKILDTRFDERLLEQHCRDFERSMEWGIKCDSCGRKEYTGRRLADGRTCCEVCGDAIELFRLRKRVTELEKQLAGVEVP
jgi:hypothetical protein